MSHSLSPLDVVQHEDQASLLQTRRRTTGQEHAEICGCFLVVTTSPWLSRPVFVSKPLLELAGTYLAPWDSVFKKVSMPNLRENDRWMDPKTPR